MIQLERRTAPVWYWWTRDHVSTPANGLLFSVTNDSFFMCDKPLDPWTPWCPIDVSTTWMSFPQKKWNTVVSTGFEFRRRAFNDGSSGKRLFALSSPHSERQSAYLKVFSDPDLSEPDLVRQELAGFFDATVGLHPMYGDESARDRRTFIGTSSTAGRWTGPQDRAYLLTSAQDLTLGEAQGILVDDFHAMSTQQLDSGGSTQLFACDGGCFDGSIYTEWLRTFDWFGGIGPSRRSWPSTTPLPRSSDQLSDRPRPAGSIPCRRSIR